MSKLNDKIKSSNAIEGMESSNWSSINPEYVARMRLQNEFKTGIDIAKYTANIMRKDMDDYDNDTSMYTQSLGCWHGFIGQQKLHPRALRGFAQLGDENARKTNRGERNISPGSH